ncbi:MAG TPA: hypothetical protein VK171_01720, partial [Fimbriimonas sp.]|nr:hypothetical protein [Fimbriimonas sp.]
MKTVFSLLGLGLIIAGCGGPAITAKRVAFELPAGFTKAESEDGTVALGVPTGWRAGVDRMMDMAGITGMSSDSGGGDASGFTGMPDGGGDMSGGQPQSDTQASIEALNQSMQKMSEEAEQEELARMAKKGVILHVIGGGKPIIGEERTRFYVKKTDEGRTWNWESAERTERDRFLHKPKWTEVDLQIGKVHMAEESRQQIDGSNKTLIVYLVIDGTALYSVRFITQETPELVKSIARPVM